MASAVQQARAANLEDLEAVKIFFSNLSDADIMRYYLNLNRNEFLGTPLLTESTICVAIDTKVWNVDSEKVKEVGISTFSSRDMASLDSPGPWGETLLKQIYFYFARLERNAHLRNTNASAGLPERNRFGKMRLLNDVEMIRFLSEVFEWPLNDRNDGFLCPVVLLNHNARQDVHRMKRILNYNPKAAGNLAQIIDTQIIVRDVGIWNHKHYQIGLQRLVTGLGFEYRDPHTASNDAAMTIISAILLVLYKSFKGNTQTRSLQDVVDDIELGLQNHDWSHGTAHFCFSCGSRSHMQENGGKHGGECQAKVHCNHCAVERPALKFTNRTESCVMTAFKFGNTFRAAQKSKSRNEGQWSKSVLDI